MRYFDIRQTAPLPSGGHPSSSALPLMFIRPFPARTPRAFHRGRRRPWGRPASRCRTRGFPPVRTRPCGRRSSPPPAPSPTRRSDRLSPPPLSPARRAGPCDTPPFRIALCYPTDAQVPQAALRGRLLGVVSVVGPLEPVAVAGQRLHGQRLLAPRGAGEAGGDSAEFQGSGNTVSPVPGAVKDAPGTSNAPNRAEQAVQIWQVFREFRREETGRKGIWGEISSPLITSR